MTCDLRQGKHTLTVVNVNKGESKFGPTDKDYTLKLPEEESRKWYPSVAFHVRGAECTVSFE